MKVASEQPAESVQSRHGCSSTWWCALAVIPPIVAVLTTVIAPDPQGHWTEHLASATLKTAQLVLLVALMAAVGWRDFRWLPLLAFVAVAIGVVLQAVGDFEVAVSIWATTGDPGFGAQYDGGHDRAALGDLVVLAGGLAFAVVAGVTHWAPRRVAVLAAVLALIPPPFLWPGVGVLALLLYVLVVQGRSSSVVAGR